MATLARTSSSLTRCKCRRRCGPLSPRAPARRTRAPSARPLKLCVPWRQGASELSGKIRDMLGDQKDFYVIVQSACKTEQIMDVKMMTN